MTRATALLRLPVAWIWVSAGTRDRARGDRLVVVVGGGCGLAGGALLLLGLAGGALLGGQLALLADRDRLEVGAGHDVLLGGLRAAWAPASRRLGGLLGGGLRGVSASAAGSSARALRRRLRAARPAPRRRAPRAPRRRAPRLLLGAALLGRGLLGRGSRAARASASGVSSFSPCSRSASSSRSLAHLQGLRLLGGMGMVGPGVDLELEQLLAGHLVAGKHPLDGEPDHVLGLAVEHLLEGAGADPARVAAVAVVALALQLVAGDRDLLGVDDDDEVADVAVRRVLRLPLARAGRRRSGSRVGRGSGPRRRRRTSRAGGSRVWLRRSSFRETAALRPGRVPRGRRDDSHCGAAPSAGRVGAGKAAGRRFPAAGDAVILPPAKGPAEFPGARVGEAGEPHGSRTRQETATMGRIQATKPGSAALSARARQLTP